MWVTKLMRTLVAGSGGEDMEDITVSASEKKIVDVVMFS